MTTAFRVGVFAVATVIGIFVVWSMLSNFSLSRNSYQIGVHFRNVSGLLEGSSVQLAGVDIGTVDKIKLLPDQTASVVCTINGDNTVYRGSTFTVATTLTGQSTLTIYPPPDLTSAVPLPRRVLPEGEQPEGVVPPTIADLVSEGQSRLRSLDKTLAIVNAELPGMVHHFNNVATHTDTLIVHVDRNFDLLGQQLNTTVASVNQLIVGFGVIMNQNGSNVTAMTTSLRGLMESKGPKFAALVDDLAATADNLNKTMAAVTSIATDPSLKSNLATATANLRDSSERLKEVTSEIQSITGDPQVQTQLRGAIYNLSGAIAKANAILSSFSGASGTQVSGSNSGSGASPQNSGNGPGANTSPAGMQHVGAPGGLDLATAHVRLTWNNGSPGPMSDLNLELLPRAPVHLTVGANDLGYHTTYNFLVNMQRTAQLQYSFGVLYSNLGAQAIYQPAGLFGVDARLYDPKQPKLDLYGDIRLAQRLQLFYGERSLMGPANLRTPAFGAQFNY
ncbi:MAG TPA: MlaD family protein [Candidatus Acidoferrales bacterium]|nr:MlaD family protein [Candidatus Acidoferrales bacterium]